MAMQIVQIDYQLIDQLIQRCANQQTQIQAIVQQLRQTIQALEHGGWQGDAAKACFSQFHHEIVPAYQRLDCVFAESQCVLKAIAKAFHEAEAEAATLFNAQSEQPNPLHDQQQPAAMPTIVNQFRQWLQTPQQSLVIETIRLIPLEQRQALLQNQTVLQAIRGLPGILPQTIIASLLEGSLTWYEASVSLKDGKLNASIEQNREIQAGHKHITYLANRLIFDTNPILPSFDMYVQADDILPDNYTQWNMNCWESVLYIGLLAGDLTLHDIDEIYTNVIKQANLAEDDVEAQKLAVRQALAEGLGYTQRQGWCEGALIPEGSIVFFESGDNPISHVAYATGRIALDGSPEIISLWERPNDTKSVQFTSIGELKGSDDSITFTANPWLNAQQPSWYNSETIISS
ncbi:WXG100 family type VII secretion target [Herpetosiphon geysericola]|uniref:Uncharacterized protein n=1 Tax=Herpetosiphon geysericola TaxID=70996 RepID=A0A0P6XYC8_9CHLR|nr:WXG100 family type VII secretion target [Herpetosiphon geysericola]KPL81207.1 hypothetical protein SE18_21185 [Herpetosiphon geysericola]